MSALVDVTWNGPFVGEIAGRSVHPGDTLQVTEQQAKSSHFKRVSQHHAAKPTVQPVESKGEAS